MRSPNSFHTCMVYVREAAHSKAFCGGVGIKCTSQYLREVKTLSGKGGRGESRAIHAYHWVLELHSDA